MKLKIGHFRANRLSALLAALVCIFATAPANAKYEGTIEWLDVELPPQHHIPEGPFKAQGISNNIYKLIEQHVTDYKHTFNVVPIVRMFKSMENYDPNKVACAISIKKSAKRDKYLDYSIPALFIPGHGVTFRKGEENTFTSGSLRELLGNKNLTLGITGSRVYGGEIDTLINENKGDNINIRKSNNNFLKHSQMLLSNRVDYVLGYAMENGYVGQTEGISDQIGFIPLVEATKYSYTYITCTRSVHTAEVLGAINKFLIEHRPSAAYRSYHEMWLDKSFIPQYRKDYDKQFISVVE